MTTPQERVSLNADGSLDEIWVTGVSVHVEQMDSGHWWIGIYRDRGELMLHFTSPKKITAFWEDDLGLAVLKEQETPDGWKVLPVVSG